jgi:hypothetical protein
MVSDKIRCLIVKKRRARTKHQTTKLPSLKAVYNKFFNSLKKSLAKYKLYEFEQKFHSLSVIDGVYGEKLSDYLNIKLLHLKLLNADNSLAVSDAEKANVF